MIVCKEVLEAAGPVSASGQKTEHAVLAAHVAVPRVLFDGRVGRPWTHEEVDTFHAKTPAQERETSPSRRVISSPSTAPPERRFAISLKIDR